MSETQARRQVTLPFTPRAWQRPLLDDPAKRIVAVVHRRAGKSTCLIWKGLKAALTTTKPLPRVVDILPYSIMWSRTGLWDQLVAAAQHIPGAEIRKSNMSVQFANGGTFQCGGADNQDSWRGGYSDLCILDEYDDMPMSMVPLIVEPMLADRDGTLIRSGTPKGKNLLKEAYDRARHAKDYSSYLLDYTKTQALSDTAIERLKAEMSDEEFAQELLCSFESPNSGSYYGKLMQEAEDEGRITNVPHEPTLKVTTAWDLGVDDSTAIWFLQTLRSGEWRCIDYLEDSGEGLDHYVRLLKQRGYTYDRHILPHDAQVRELGSGKSRTETLHSLGLKPTRIIRSHSVADGINAVRMVLPRCWFDAYKCALGIKALRGYRREWNEKAETWRSNPVHDHASHGADAMRYLALGVRENTQPLAEPEWADQYQTTHPSAGSTNWMGI